MILILRENNKIIGRGFSATWRPIKDQNNENQFIEELEETPENINWLKKEKHEIYWDNGPKIKTKTEIGTELTKKEIKEMLDEIIDMKLRLDKAKEIDENINHVVLTKYIQVLTNNIQAKQSELMEKIK